MNIRYRVFKIPKRKGGYRVIEQPIGKGMEYLRDLLKELEDIEELKPSYFCHSFMHGRNIATCAQQHKGKKHIVRLDIHDFFPSVKWELFGSVVLWGKNPGKIHHSKLSRLERLHVKLKVAFRYHKKGKYHYLPQGAPTSPFLANAYLKHFDWAAGWFCYDRGVVYNRYADDIYLSADEKDANLWSCIFYIKNSLKKLGLEENKKKRKFMHHGKQMNVVGVVINEKFQVPRKTRRIIRAMLHNAKRDKVELTQEQQGLIAFSQMVANWDKPVKSNLEICKGYSVAKGF